MRVLVAASLEVWVLEKSGSLNKNQNTVITGKKIGWDCVPELAQAHFKSFTWPSWLRRWYSLVPFSSYSGHIDIQLKSIHLQFVTHREDSSNTLLFYTGHLKNVPLLCARYSSYSSRVNINCTVWRATEIRSYGKGGWSEPSFLSIGSI